MRPIGTIRLAVLALAPAAGLAAGAEPAAVLGRQDYWRSFCTMAPALREDGKTYAPYHTYYGVGNLVAAGALKPVPPPADWMKPEFDDSAWVCVRGALGAGKAQIIRHQFLRARFDVPDPAAVKSLRLTAAVRGGAVVYLNGEEVGRVAVPAGAVGLETFADRYPDEAYAWTRDGVRKYVADFHFGQPYPQGGKGFFYGGWASEIFVPREAPKDGLLVLTEEEWKKVNALRNRPLGPAELPTRLLRKGANLFAMAVVSSRIPTDFLPAGDNKAWPHGQLLDCRLTCDPPGAARGAAAARGLRVWAADIHQQVFNFDDAPAAAPEPRLVLAGARNGHFSAQLALRSDQAVRGLAATASDLAGPGGAAIPAAAVRVRWGLASPVDELENCDLSGRSLHFRKLLERYSAEVGALPEKEQGRALRYFDRLSGAPPAEVPGGSCQTVWVTVRVPSSAAPGEYRGTLKLRAGAGAELAVPLVLGVAAWTLPDPAAFESVVGLEQSPWGVLEAYPQVRPWSDEHFRLMDRSFAMLAELGADVVNCPVLAPSEFGNRKDSLVPWIKKPGGGYEYDFSRLDRYLDLAVKHLGRPRVIELVVGQVDLNKRQHGVALVEKPGGPTTGYQALPDPATEEGVRPWVDFGRAAYAHFKEKGLAESLHWGHFWDRCAIGELQKALAAAVPEVGWVRSCHHVAPPKQGVRYGSTVLVLPPAPEAKDKHWSLRGWRTPELHVCHPRVSNTTITVNTNSWPLSFRMLPERALVHGGRGAGRLGFDYWGNYGQGWSGPTFWCGMNMQSLAWPGPEGAEGTVRFEAFREGLQEAEARIALEKVLDGGRGDSPEGRAAWAVLDGRVRELAFIPASWPSPLAEFHCGWQERSRALYAAAAGLANGKR